MVARFVPLVLVVLGTMAACGPSLRRVHTADVYFERCYAGDRDDRYSDVERRRCWDAWLADYTVGQSDERISHAHERLLMLDPEGSALVELATGEGGLEAAESSAVPLESAPIVVLTATATRAELDGGSDPGTREVTPELRARHRPSTPRTITTHCDETCAPPWEACVDACDDRDRGCFNACRMRLRSCASGCY